MHVDHIKHTNGPRGENQYFTNKYRQTNIQSSGGIQIRNPRHAMHKTAQLLRSELGILFAEQVIRSFI
jgi:hypothetical protein